MAGARITVDLKGLAEVQALIERAERAVQPPVVTSAVAAAAKRYQDGARARAPKRSGRLAGSIGYRTTGGYSAQTSTDLIYAQIQELGGTITPKRARALRFEADGRVVFAQRVTIPAQPYFVPTFEQDTDSAFDEFVDVIDGYIGF